MENVIYYNSLYDLYGLLLTEKQRQYFEEYYFHNLSFSEMAENYDVSRNAVFKQVHTVLLKLDEYEEKLGLFDKKKRLEEIILKIDNSSVKEQLENLF